MSKDKDSGKNVKKTLADIARSMNNEIHIGFKGHDKITFDVLRDLINANHREYEQVKEEEYIFPNSNEENIKISYKELYSKFEEENYDIIREKAIRNDAKIVMLYDKKIKGKLKINAYYFKENS